MATHKALIKLLSYREHLRTQAERNVVSAKAGYDAAHQYLLACIRERDEIPDLAHTHLTTLLASASMHAVCDAAAQRLHQAKQQWEEAIILYQRADADKSSLEKQLEELRKQQDAFIARKEATEIDDRTLARWNRSNSSIESRE